MPADDDDISLLDDFGDEDLGGLDEDDGGGGGGGLADDIGGMFGGSEDADDLIASVTGGGNAPRPQNAPTGPTLGDISGVDQQQAVYDIPVQISAVLGKATMQVSQLLKLGRGAVVELDRKVGEAIDIYVNNRLVARGEVVVVDDRLGVTLTEIIRRTG